MIDQTLGCTDEFALTVTSVFQYIRQTMYCPANGLPAKSTFRANALRYYQIGCEKNIQSVIIFRCPKLQIQRFTFITFSNFGIIAVLPPGEINSRIQGSQHSYFNGSTNKLAIETLSE